LPLSVFFCAKMVLGLLLSTLLPVVSVAAVKKGSYHGSGPCDGDVSLLLDAVFDKLGNDCDTWGSLFAPNATYYHQHAGFARNEPPNYLNTVCHNYGSFCPPGACNFRQDGAPVLMSVAVNECHMLVPYLWAQLPADESNMEPHNGWEYMIAVPDEDSEFLYALKSFAEFETSYSVATNWGNPLDTTVYSWTTDLLNGTASNGECDTPVLPFLTYFFFDVNSEEAEVVWRQQGDAVVLAAGIHNGVEDPICHVAVPYAAEMRDFYNTPYLETGVVVFRLDAWEGLYTIQSSVVFPVAREWDDPEYTDACAKGNMTGMLTEIFTSLGDDCDAWVSLWSKNATYYQQHAGFANYNGLMASCQKGYCPWPRDNCVFRQNGPALMMSGEDDGRCYVLAPYVWAQNPANKTNLEPHTGWEYIILSPMADAEYGYLMDSFSEIETSYSVAYNWGVPGDTSKYSWTTDLLDGTASNGECSLPTPTVITQLFATISKNGSNDSIKLVLRQQGAAVVLAAGGLCHVLVPIVLQEYVSKDHWQMDSGYAVLVLKPYNDLYYNIQDVRLFANDNELENKVRRRIAQAVGKRL